MLCYLIAEVRLRFDLVREFRSAIVEFPLRFRDENFKLRILDFALSGLDNHCAARLVKCYACHLRLLL